jgi:hypothetical protein
MLTRRLGGSLAVARLPIWILCLLSATVDLTAQTRRPPAAPWALTPQSAIPITVPAAIRLVVGADLEYDDTEPIKGAAVDLNRDGVVDYLLQSAPSLCGNGGCVYVLCDGKTRRKLGEFLGSPLYVQAEVTHDYPKIATYSHQSAASATFTEYGFDGKAYVVTSARTVEGAALDQLLSTLRQVPTWRPAR